MPKTTAAKAPKGSPKKAKQTKRISKASKDKKTKAGKQAESKPLTSVHIGAPIGGNKFGEVVLMPGDPLRAKWMAETFLSDVELITNVRGMNGFTGYFEGVKLSILGTGMGMSSGGIYWHELINDYGVKKIIRTGTAGTTKPSPACTKVGDIILSMAAGTDANVNRNRFSGWDLPASADWTMLHAAYQVTQSPKMQAMLKKNKTDVHVGNVMSAETFYHPREDEVWTGMSKHGILGIEMEAAGLYGIARQFGAQALAINIVRNTIELQGYDPVTGQWKDPRNKLKFHESDPAVFKPLME